MPIVLDHVTHFVNDRNIAADNLRALGFNATPGGRHPGVGSANNLCYFGLFYIELLAVVDPEEAMNGPSGVCRAAVAYLEKGEGFGNVAFETSDIAADVAAMRSSGLDVDEPVHMQRVQPDGFVSHSLIAYPRLPEPAPIPVPILIERSLGVVERERMLRSKRVIAPHPVGQVDVDYVAICTANLDLAQRLLNERFGLKAPMREYRDEVIAARCVRLQTDRGGVVLCAPDGDGLVARQLTHRAGPFLLALKASNDGALGAKLKANSDGLVSPQRLHGTWLRITNSREGAL